MILPIQQFLEVDLWHRAAHGLLTGCCVCIAYWLLTGCLLVAAYVLLTGCLLTAHWLLTYCVHFPCF